MILSFSRVVRGDEASIPGLTNLEELCRTLTPVIHQTSGNGLDEDSGENRPKTQESSQEDVSRPEPSLSRNGQTLPKFESPKFIDVGLCSYGGSIMPDRVIQGFTLAPVQMTGQNLYLTPMINNIPRPIINWMPTPTNYFQNTCWMPMPL